MIGADYHDITQLLPLIGKNCTISVVDKQNITVNRQNWLIAHPLVCIQVYGDVKCSIGNTLSDSLVHYQYVRISAINLLLATCPNNNHRFSHSL